MKSIYDWSVRSAFEVKSIYDWSVTSAFEVKSIYDWSVRSAFHEVLRAAEPKLCVLSCIMSVKCETSATS